MSLLTRPRHVVTLREGEESKDKYNRPVARLVNGAPQREVPCNVHPLSVEETIRYGVTETVARKVIARTWPAGRWDQVIFGGYRWDVVSAELYDMSPTTTHWEIIIRRQEAVDG